MRASFEHRGLLFQQGPYIPVTLISPDGKKFLPRVPALLDSGADQSLIWSSIADQLGLAVGDSEPIHGVGCSTEGHRRQAQIVLHGDSFCAESYRLLNPVEVLSVSATDRLPKVILGRDVIRLGTLVLSGNAFSFSLS